MTSDELRKVLRTMDVDDRPGAFQAWVEACECKKQPDEDPKDQSD